MLWTDLISTTQPISPPSFLTFPLSFLAQRMAPDSPEPSSGDTYPPPGLAKALNQQALYFFFFELFFFFFICSEFCHTLEWNSYGFTCVPDPDPPSHLPLHPLPLGFPSAPGPSACLIHPTWAGDLFHPRYYTCFDAVLLKHPILSFSHRV